MKLQKGLSANTIKLIAIIAMLIDHIAWCFLPFEHPVTIIMHMIGRITAPVICFFVAEGYFHTRNLNKYLLRMLICALFSHVAFTFCFDYAIWETTSVIWGLMLGIIALEASRRENLKLWQRMVVIILCMVLALPGDWAAFTVLWILFFGYYHGDFARQMQSLALIGLFGVVLPSVLSDGWENLFQAAFLLSIPLLACYKGEKGRGRWMKWFFYFFYPAHLVVLGIIWRSLAGAW